MTKKEYNAYNKAIKENPELETLHNKMIGDIAIIKVSLEALDVLTTKLTNSEKVSATSTELYINAIDAVEELCNYIEELERKNVFRFIEEKKNQAA